MRWARPSTTAVLPTPGSPTSTGLFLVRRERICMIRSISTSRPTTGSSLPSEASLVRLRPNWSSSFEDFLPSPGPAAAPDWLELPWPGPGAPAAGAGQHPDDLVADLLRVRVEVEQDACGDALVLAYEAEQDVLGGDVVVAEGEGLAERQLQHLLRTRREGDLARGHLLTGADDADHLGAYTLDGDVQALEHAGGKPLLLTEETKEDVLGPDVVVLERPRLLLGEDDHLACALCESLEHGGGMLPSC